MPRALSSVRAAPHTAALRPLSAAIANRDTAPAEIVWWGDSVSEGSTLSDQKHSVVYRFQEMLRGAFPAEGVRGGRGYIPVYNESASLPDEWATDLTANLGGTSTVTAEIQSGLGAKGWQLKNGAAVTITQDFTDFDVHYSKGPFGVGFNVFVDGVQQGGTIPTTNGTIQGGWVQSYTGFTPGSHTVKIQTTDSAGFVSVIHGAAFFTGDKNKGIHVYNAAKSGASASAPSFNVEHFRHLTTIAPAAVVVQLITNDAIFFSSPSAYRTALDTLLSRIATAMSGVSFTLIGLAVSQPNNSFVGGALWPSYTQQMRQAIESYTNGVFVDMGNFQGPTVLGDTLGLWSDGVHLSRKGAQYTADRLLWELELTGGGELNPPLGGDLTGTAANAQIAASAVGTTELANLAVTDAKVAAANKDGTSGTPSMRTLGTGAAQAAAGNDSRITGAEQTSNKGAASGYASLDSGTKVPIAQLPTGTSSTTVAIGNDSRITGAQQTSQKNTANGYPGLDASGFIDLSRVPPGYLHVARKVGGNWPGGTSSTATRPTNRTDVVVAWMGADPSPPIVSSGTGGMLDNVDVRWITP